MTTRGTTRNASDSSAAASEAAPKGDPMPANLARTQKALAARRANAANRRAKTAARNAVIATRTAPTGYRIGQWVRTNTPRCRPFHDRVGVVVTNNLGEVGVGFGTDWAIQLPGVDAWFLPSELERVR